MSQAVSSGQSAERIVSVGAGRMGRGIAITFALAGYDVCLVDAKDRTADEFDALRIDALQEVTETLGMLSELNVLACNAVAATAARVRCFALSESEQVLQNADVIFEAVPEILEVKKAAFQLITQQATADAIVASTTSTILSDALQPYVEPATRFLNAHWLNPAFVVPLVEVSPGAQTDPAVIQQLEQLLERIGKVPVRCAASPGYIVPRIQAMAMNEAARMVEEGVASASDIDKATRFGFGFRFAVLGLLEFIDWGGGDILFYASRYMTDALGNDRYSAPEIIRAHMQQGRIGLKSGRGFLDYSNLDISEYQQGKLSEFIALLRHIGQMPTVSEYRPCVDTLVETRAQTVVRQYLAAMERRDLVDAQSFLAPDFSMTFPGGVKFTSLQELVQWSKTRYRCISKSFECFDQSESGEGTVVYCSGTLQGVWLDGTPLSDVRFIDRFVVREGLIVLQQVWNDLAEAAAKVHG